MNRTRLLIDLKALENNYTYLKSKLKEGVKFMAVVKANSYGSDDVQIAQKLEALKADYFAVAFTQEGIKLRNAGITTPIMVLHPQSGQLEELYNYHLEPTIYSKRMLEQVIELAPYAEGTLKIHVKFNTGLNRLGFLKKEVEGVVQALTSNAKLELASVYSHLIATEDPKLTKVCLDQIDHFSQITTELKNRGIKIPLQHIVNTSGILNFPEAQFDMVRSGIGLYGFSNIPAQEQYFTPIGSLVTEISMIHQVEKGESVGYNQGFIADKTKKIATLPIGHADGISRLYSKGKGVVWIADQAAPIVGNVCMDMIMVDVTGIDCKEGDSVTLFDSLHRASEFAERAGTISYEILTAIGPRVTRYIY